MASKFLIYLVLAALIPSLWLAPSSAQSEKSAFEKSLEQDTGVNSSESWVKILDQRYRKIEFNGGSYYVQFRKGDKAREVADVFCQPPEEYKAERLIVSDSQRFRRSRAFVQAFHGACTNVRNNKKVEFQLPAELKALLEN